MGTVHALHSHLCELTALVDIDVERASRFSAESGRTVRLISAPSPLFFADGTSVQIGGRGDYGQNWSLLQFAASARGNRSCSRGRIRPA